MKLKLFFLLLFAFITCIFSFEVKSQEACNCKLIYNSINEKMVNPFDSLEVFRYSDELKKSKFSSCVVNGFQLEFDFYIRKKEIKKAKLVLEKQLNLLKKMNCKKLYDYSIFANQANYYKVVGDLENFSIYAYKLLKEAEKSNDIQNQINAIQEIVYLNTRMGEQNKNWTFILRAQKLIENEIKSQNKQTTRNYRWLAFEYENKYTLVQRKTLVDSALIFANKFKKNAFKFKMIDEITGFYRLKESCSYHKGDIKNALIYIDSAIFYAKKMKGTKNLASLYTAKAWDHLDYNQSREAIKWMDTAIIAVNDIKDAEGKMMLYYDASNLYKGAKNVDKAFESYKMYSKIKDSVWKIKKVEKIAVLEQKYNKAKNEKMIFELEKTKQFYTFLIILSLLALLVLIFFFRQRSLLNKQKIMHTEQRLNRARINPHFFFNALASLQNVSLEEKSTKTTLFISRFAKIMRQSLESTYEELVSIESEIAFSTNYLELQRLRFPDKFDFQFHIDDALEINELKIPGMIIQPFVENSIEHGFKNIDYKGKIDISFSQEDDGIIVIIKDNGIGNYFEKKEENHKSRAMQIIKDRLYLFNKQNHSNATYQIEDVANNDGFKIIITLPKIY